MLMLASCGGSGTGAVPAAMRASARVQFDAAEGTLLQSPGQLISTVTAASLLVELNLATNLQLLSLSGSPVCDVLIYKIQYETVGGANEPTTASAALMIPSGLGSGCTGARPIVMYAHGTSELDRSRVNVGATGAEHLPRRLEHLLRLPCVGVVQQQNPRRPLATPGTGRIRHATSIVKFRTLAFSW